MLHGMTSLGTFGSSKVLLHFFRTTLWNVWGAILMYLQTVLIIDRYCGLTEFPELVNCLLVLNDGHC